LSESNPQRTINQPQDDLQFAKSIFNNHHFFRLYAPAILIIHPGIGANIYQGAFYLIYFIIYFLFSIGMSTGHRNIDMAAWGMNMQNDNQICILQTKMTILGTPAPALL